LLILNLIKERSIMEKPLLTSEQLGEIATQVATIIAKSNESLRSKQIIEDEDTPEGAEYNAETGEVVYSDPAVQAADEMEMDLIKSLPRGVVQVRGRSGTTMVNHSQESLEAIANWKRNRRQYRTRQVIR
jgi:hypothetical protein